MTLPQLTDEAPWRQYIANGGDRELRTLVQQLRGECAQRAADCAQLRKDVAEMQVAYDAQVDALEATNAVLLRHIDTLQSKRTADGG